ncbi:MAG: hypothetical protein ACI8XO_000837 [Verrucomicrobiales bacterium]|jgi:hypothetical protein
MRKIFEHIEFARVGHYQSILEDAGIATSIKNLGASSGSGEIPFTEVFPELWVNNDDQYDRAMELLEPYHNKEIPSEAAWQCPNCTEQVPGSFGQCWQCQTMRPTA